MDAFDERPLVTPTFPVFAAQPVADGAVPVPPTLTNVAAWETFVGAFSTATGWTPRMTAAPAPSTRRDLCSFVWPAVGDAGPRFWTLEANCGVGVSPVQTGLAQVLAGGTPTPQSGTSTPQSPTPPISRVRLEPLAKAAVDLAAELELTRLALWQREAELAAAVPVVPHRDEPRVLARKLESLLRSAGESVECQAAALYLLDEGTTELKLRALWNLPLTRLLQPGRPLRGALADVEALSGHAVALENTKLLPHWRVPEPDFASAACVPVSSATTLLGTLWTFGTSVRDFTERDTNILEVISGRIAAELEREVLMQNVADRREQEKQQVSARKIWQGFRPVTPPRVPGWEMSAAIWPEASSDAAIYDWSLQDNGQLAIALGETAGTGLTAIPTAATMLATLRAERTRGGSPLAIVERTGDALLAASNDGERGSLVAGDLDPITGRLTLVGGGTTRAIWSTRRSGCLITPDSSLQLLGDLDATRDNLSESMLPIATGESLLLVNDALWKRWNEPGVKKPELALASAVRKRGKATAKELLGQLQDLTPGGESREGEEAFAALLLRRLPQTPTPTRKKAPSRRKK